MVILHILLALAALFVFLLIVIAVKYEPDEGWGIRLHVLSAAMTILAGASLMLP